MKRYKVLMHHMSYNKALSYLQDINNGNASAGSYLSKSLQNMDISQLQVEEFIELIVRTKQPQIFAETDISGDGSDWNQTELSILGDISITVPVTVFDNGLHRNPVIHKPPFSATLIFIPGALLRNDQGSMPADWSEVVVNDQIQFEAFYSLYERRLLPAFIHTNAVAESNNKKALITIPGIGCGQFAGPFTGQLGEYLKNVLIRLLKDHGEHFSNIAAVYFDPYQECDNERLEINGISLFVRPLTKGNENKPQLCKPQKYEEDNDDFSDCELFSFVAWDHVSWPGNDFYIGSRSTDDGVKAAATDSMFMMTGVEGNYNEQTHTSDPPKEYENWRDVILKKRIQIHVRDNLLVFPIYPVDTGHMFHRC